MANPATISRLLVALFAQKIRPERPASHPPGPLELSILPSFYMRNIFGFHWGKNTNSGTEYVRPLNSFMVGYWRCGVEGVSLERGQFPYVLLQSMSVTL